MVEVLLALAIGGLVLMAASALLVTISQAWANRPATRDAFDAHINGVAHFLTAVFEEATKSSESTSSNNIISLERPVGFSERDDPLLTFYLSEAPPLFYWPHGMANRIHVYLKFDEGEALYFLWFSELQELEKKESGKFGPEDENQLFLTQISPYLDEVYYCYYGEEETTPEEEKRWHYFSELEENVDSGKFRIPDFLKIVFRWEEEDLERTITLAIKRPFPSGIEEDRN